jgi:2-oxoglutarate ferredoxin oxidoreductase subunit delta
MTKNTKLFWVDMALFVLLALTVLTVGPEIFTHTFVHVFLGILLSAGALLHLVLHWSWIKNAFQRFDRLPDPARGNARLDLALFCAYLLCGGMGLTARTMLIILPLHVLLGFVHALLAILVIVLQVIHIARHWKWLVATGRRMVPQANLPFSIHHHTSTKYIQLNTRKCQACWKCAEACPNHVLGKAILFNHRHAHVDYAAACKGCKKCVRACPNQAILYTFAPSGPESRPAPNTLA